MFLLLPTRSDQAIRRWPVCVMLIALLNIAVFAATLVREHHLEHDLSSLTLEAAEILRQNPDLMPSEELAYQIAKQPRAAWRLDNPDPKLQGVAVQRDATDLRAIEQRLTSLMASDLRSHFAYGRKQSDWWRLLSSQFTHGGWEHIFFNLWFLWVIGVPLEDRWGRVVFPIFYVAGGIAGSLLQTLTVSGSSIGASGAIAAVMGAVALQMPRSRLHLLFITLLPIPISLSGRYGRIIRLLRFPPLGLVLGRLAPPAWLALCAWGGTELYFGAVEQHSGIGHFAHIGGFVFGILVAALFRITGFDVSVDAAVERSGAVMQHPELLSAAALTDQGRPGIAILRLRKLLADPQCMPVDVHLELLRAAEKANSRRDEAASRAALLEIYLRTGGPVRELFAETRQRGLEDQLPEPLRAQLRRLHASS